MSRRFQILSVLAGVTVCLGIYGGYSYYQRQAKNKKQNQGDIHLETVQDVIIVPETIFKPSSVFVTEPDGDQSFTGPDGLFIDDALISHLPFPEGSEINDETLCICCEIDDVESNFTITTYLQGSIVTIRGSILGDPRMIVNKIIETTIENIETSSVFDDDDKDFLTRRITSLFDI